MAEDRRLKSNNIILPIIVGIVIMFAMACGTAIFLTVVFLMKTVPIPAPMDEAQVEMVYAEELGELDDDTDLIDQDLIDSLDAAEKIGDETPVENPLEDVLKVLDK